MKLRPHVLRFAATAVVFAPFAMSVAAHAIKGATATSETAERPALAFREYLLNFGRVPEGQAVSGRFWFVNSGEKRLTILGFEPSCGCLTPRLDKTAYAPGEQGMFIVVADTAGESVSETSSDPAANKDQLKQHFVDVRYDAGDGEQTARVHIKFVLPARRITVEPRSLLVYQFNDEPTTRTITVTDRRSPPVRVLTVDCPNQDVLLETQIAQANDQPTRATIAITIPQAPSGRVVTWVTIMTDDPEQPRIDIPIDIRVHDAQQDRLGSNPLDLVPRGEVRR